MHGKLQIGISHNHPIMAPPAIYNIKIGTHLKPMLHTPLNSTLKSLYNLLLDALNCYLMFKTLQSSHP